MTILAAIVFWLLLAVPVWPAAYYISPTGSNSNNGTSTATPWQTFTYALANTTCGDALILRNGTYGDGTSTGKISLSGRVCAQGNEFTIISENQRQAKIVDNGSGTAVRVSGSAYIVIDGLYARSTDNSGSASGYPFFAVGNNHITLRNLVARNPNRYANTHAIAVEQSQQVLLEDNEVYIFHRHCVEALQSVEVVVRRQYCNPRGGRIAGGFGSDTKPLGSADALVTMYPCGNCVLENSIADGTTHAMYLNEMNATYDGNVVLTGSKVLGSICYRCQFGTGIFINSRKASDLNHTPQNITIRDVAFIDWGATGGNWSGVRFSDCAGTNGCTADHIYLNNVLGTGAYGITSDNNSLGVPSSLNKLTLTNSAVAGFTNASFGIGFQITGFDTFTVNETISNGNRVNYNPASDPASASQTLSNTSTAALNYGSCKGVWVPAGATGKGAGTNGEDIGANILYRYVNGVLTNTTLWDLATGEFPHGEADLDNTNRVAGQSLFDLHTRLNINTIDCPFPAGYGGGGTGEGPDFDASTRKTSTDLDGPHVITIPAGMKSLTVGAMAWHAGQNVGYATGIQSSCGSGEAIPALATQSITSPAYRSVRSFGLINPSSGTCTITPTFTGNVDGWTMISVMDNNTGSYGTVTSALGLSSTPSATAIANSDYQLIDFLATSSSSTLSVGPWQTSTAEVSHPSVSLRGASSLQLAANDTIMSYTLGIAPYWAMQVVPLVPPAAGPPTTAQLTQTQYGIYAGHGSEEGSAPLAATNTSATISPGGMFRVRFEIQGSVATTTPFGVALYCRKNADAYTRVMDDYGSNVFRFFGAGVEAELPRVPASLTPTTQRLNTGSFVPGAFIRDQASVFIVPALTVGQRTELAFAVVNNASEGDTINCRVQQDDGSQLSAYNVVSAVTIIPPREIRGF